MPQSLVSAMHLLDLHKGQSTTIVTVGGERGFRRRLMELGLVPGTAVTFVGVAPLGDPLEFSVRGCSLSIRRAEAARIKVSPQPRTLDCCSSETSPAGNLVSQS